MTKLEKAKKDLEEVEKKYEESSAYDFKKIAKGLKAKGLMAKPFRKFSKTDMLFFFALIREATTHSIKFKFD